MFGGGLRCVGLGFSRRTSARSTSDPQRNAFPWRVGNKRIWYFGLGSHSRRLHVGHGPAFARTHSISDQLLVGQKGLGSVYHLLDSISIFTLGCHSGRWKSWASLGAYFYLFSRFGGHSLIMLTLFWSFWSAPVSWVDIYEGIPLLLEVKICIPLTLPVFTTSSCQRSLWMPPYKIFFCSLSSYFFQKDKIWTTFYI